eukprot:5434937-Pyramimonas_sp.AAC.1
MPARTHGSRGERRPASSSVSQSGGPSKSRSQRDPSRDARSVPSADKVDLLLSSLQRLSQQ